jgi:hypothetical protein
MKSRTEMITAYTDNVIKFFENYIFLELPSDVDAWVAGGALRDFFLYGCVKSGTDIDIFTTNQANYDKIVAELLNYYDKQKESEFAITLTHKEDDDKIVQVIKKFHETPEQCISNFDLLCCCAFVRKAWWDGQPVDSPGLVACAYGDYVPEFFDDNYTKTLNFLKLNENPNTTLYRIQKYIKKGYSITDENILTMIKCYLHSDTNFASLISEYEGLRVEKNNNIK